MRLGSSLAAAGFVVALIACGSGGASSGNGGSACDLGQQCGPDCCAIGESCVNGVCSRRCANSSDCPDAASPCCGATTGVCMASGFGECLCANSAECYPGMCVPSAVGRYFVCAPTDGLPYHGCLDGIPCQSTAYCCVHDDAQNNYCALKGCTSDADCAALQCYPNVCDGGFGVCAP